MSKRLWWWISGGILLLIILIVVGKLNGNDGVKVAVEPAGVHTIIETVSGSGKIYPETEVKIAPEVSGEIIALNVQEGDSVRKGDLMVRINPAVYNSIVSQASASVAQSQAQSANTDQLVGQAKSQYELALASFNRNQKLYQDKVISATEFEQAKASYQGAKASYEAAKANSSGGFYGVASARAGLDQAKENLRKTTIFAPTNGIISQLNVKLGERVVGTAQMAGTDMLTIADMRRMEVRVEVSETDIAKVKVGDTTKISVDAFRGKMFLGLVSRIDLSSSSSSGTLTQASSDQVSNYTVRIYILPSSYQDLASKLGKGNFVFKPGMSASVAIQTKRVDNVLSVPVNAVSTRDWPDSLKGKEKTDDNDELRSFRQVVFVLQPKTNKVALRDVTSGIQDNDYIQILSGLKRDEQVVVAPYGAITRILKDNSSVMVVKKAALFDAEKK
ncbi:MAG: efflux RND transporter periplasmic adaptor subunit [Bacteroidetes bacterium]|nr:efflux RND transporter periplasmic adaptor subunit [Bacteroidota bacterium]